ncbi:MAG: hypothetical protein QM706_08750 [Nitrospira sp.]
MPQRERAQYERMERIKIQVPASLKAKLDALRAQGTTASGFIRNLLAQHFTEAATKRSGKTY